MLTWARHTLCGAAIRGAGKLNPFSQGWRREGVVVPVPRFFAQRNSQHSFAAIEVPPRYQPRSARDEALRYARTCYDHIAGRLGVAIADALAANGHIVLNDDGGEVTDSGREMLTRFGADLTPTFRGRRIFCRPCLDWSERRYHLAGHVGAEICRRCLELGWFKRERETRALQLTAAGRTGLAELFGLRVAEYDRSTQWARAAHAVADVPQST